MEAQIINYRRRAELRGLILADVANCRHVAPPVTMAPADRLAMHLEGAKAAATELFPDIVDWYSAIDADALHPVALVGKRALPVIEWDGPGLYEFALTLNGKTTQPTAFLDRASDRDSKIKGPAYRWQHYWRQRDIFQGRSHVVHAADLRIISKIEAF